MTELASSPAGVPATGLQVRHGAGPPAPLRAAAAATLPEHERRNGPMPVLAPGALLGMVEAAGLTGRGGAAFPTWRKLSAVALAAAAGGGTPVVVANAAEGEPASSKDQSLLEHAPHLVLDGLGLVAQALGAAEAHLYARPGAGARAATAALAERRAPGWDRVPVRLTPAPERFVAGEETAVVSLLGGGAPLPRAVVRRVAERGLGGRPTLVQNVETLAHLALVARHGPAWFRRVGTAAEPGSMLCTVSGDVRSPGVVEVAIGTAVGDVLALAGGASRPLGALLVGGYHGSWLRAGEAAGLPLSRAGLASRGATPGAGVLLALGRERCPLGEAARIATYLAEQGARQCGPCLNGLPELARALAELALPGGPAVTSRDAAQRVRALAGLVEGRGACHHPDGSVRMVRSALTAFGDEVAAHARGGCVARAGGAG